MRISDGGMEGRRGGREKGEGRRGGGKNEHQGRRQNVEEMMWFALDGIRKEGEKWREGMSGKKLEEE